MCQTLSINCFTTDDLGNMKVENHEVQTEVVETVEQYVQAGDTTQGVCDWSA